MRRAAFRRRAIPLQTSLRDLDPSRLTSPGAVRSL